jgi:hypothetical protein
VEGYALTPADAMRHASPYALGHAFARAIIAAHGQEGLRAARDAILAEAQRLEHETEEPQ